MKQYLDLLDDILANGDDRADRIGIGTIGLFGPQMEFNLSDGFPLLTTKKLHLKSIIHELLWFLSGDTNIKYLQENGVKIWDAWANEHGDLGPVYGHQWRRFGHIDDYPHGVDQIKELIDGLKKNPNGRRHIVSAWNPVDIPAMKLPPCHCLFQFNVRKNEYLDCKLYQRSVDAALGLPFNIASYALLTMMVAQVVNLKPGKFIHSMGDVHVYKNHIHGAEEQLKRKPKALPIMKINPDVKDIFSFKYEDFTLEGYDPHPHIAFKVAV